MNGGDLNHKEIIETKSNNEIGYRNIKPEHEMSIKEMKAAVKGEFDKASQEREKQYVVDSKDKVGLSEEDRIKIKEETNWSDHIINYIENMSQYKIYKEANLREAEVDGRHCLIKNIEMDYKDLKTGLTNRELLEKGRAAIDSKTGEKIELHHMGQEYDAPFVELCENSEHGDGNHSILHIKNSESWRKDEYLKKQYDNVDRPNHWKERGKEVQ